MFGTPAIIAVGEMSAIRRIKGCHMQTHHDAAETMYLKIMVIIPAMKITWPPMTPTFIGRTLIYAMDRMEVEDGVMFQGKKLE